MSAPFRSSLLNHWARKNQKRPPVAVVPWLRSSSSSKNTPPSSSFHSHRNGNEEESLDSLYSSPPAPDFEVATNRSYTEPPSLSSVDTTELALSLPPPNSGSSSSSSSSNFSASSSSSFSSSDSSSDDASAPSPVDLFSSASAPRSPKSTWARSNRNSSQIMSIPHRGSLSMPMLKATSSGLTSASARNFSTLSSLAESELDKSESIRDNVGTASIGDKKRDSKHNISPFAKSVQAFLSSCAAPPRHFFNKQHNIGTKRSPHSLRLALDRAMACATTPSPMPFTIKRMLAPSAMTHRMVEIMIRSDTTSTTKWSHIAAFVVAIVHGNQCPVSPRHEDAHQYEPLPFVPPRDEHQMEDFAKTRAAVERLRMSLAAESIDNELVSTSDEPATRTPAFRNLIEAQSTDRVAALLLVGSM